MKKWFNKDKKATIIGYIGAAFNASMLIPWDTLDYNLVSTWVKIITGILGPILMGHTSEIKTTKQ